MLLQDFYLKLNPVLNQSLGFGYLTQTCQNFVLEQSKNPNIPYLLSLLMNSGKGINQLGDYKSCIAIENASYYLGNIAISYYQTSLFMGICMDKACSIEDVLGIAMIDGTGFYRMIQPQKIQYPIDWGSILLFTIIGICLLLTVGSSIYFKIKKSQSANKSAGVKKWISYFSLQNSLKIFTKPGQIKVINGLKAVCFFFVVIGHVTFTRLSLSVNSSTIKLFTKQYFLTIILSFPYAVDTFFLLGGFMVGFLFPKIYNRNPSKWNFLRAILQRALRFWPVFILALLEYWKLFATFGYGPLFSTYKSLIGDCSKYWWSDLLFIGNFRDGMCIVWAWYIQNDMQFFVVSIILLYIYIHVNKLLSYALQIAAIAGSLVYVFVMYQINQYHTNGSYDDMLDPKASDIYLKIYIKPWCRISSYILGLIVGLIYYKKKELKQDSFIDKLMQNIWIRSMLPVFGFLLVIILASLPYTLSHDIHWPQIIHSFYASTTHLLYPFGYLLIILPILYGYWNPFKPFFENSLFQFIGKITFSCYMIHYPYLVWRSVVGYMTPYLWTSFGIIYGISQIIPIVCLGFIVAIIFQFPVAAILDDITGKRKQITRKQ